MEVWKPIDGWHYEVSNLGRVRHSNERRAGVTPHRLIKPKLWGLRYLGVDLYRGDGTCKRFWVHRLVAHAFHGPKPKGLVTSHIDGVFQHNEAVNLEYITQWSNLQERPKAPRTSAHNRKIGQALLGRQMTVEHRAKLAAAQKRLWQDPKYRTAQCESLRLRHTA